VQRGAGQGAQVRGLRAILPGVNRCKLLSDQDFDELYKDCTTQRPGRPPKRVSPYPGLGLVLSSLEVTGLAHGDPRLGPPHHLAQPPPYPPFLQPPNSHTTAQFQAPPRLPHLPGYELPQLPLEPGLLRPGLPAADTQTRVVYGDMIKSIERMKEVQGLLVAEERSNEEKLESGKNMDVEEIRAGNDEHKNEEMVEKTKRNAGEIRLRNFALTENDLDVSRGNNNRASKAKEGKRTDDTDNSQDVDTGGTDDVNDATINQTESNDCSMENVLGSIQEMVRHAARAAVRQSASGPNELHRELQSEKTSRISLRRRLRQIRQSGATYLRQFKREKRLRLKLEEDLVLEIKKKFLF